MTLATIDQVQRFHLMPHDPDKDTKYRVGAFLAWQTQSGQPWHSPDLAEYRDHLLATGKAPSTVSAHLSTVRARYDDLLRNNEMDAMLDHVAGLYLVSKGEDNTSANREAETNKIRRRLRNATDPKNAKVKVKTVQDQADASHLRLTSEQASALLAAPGTDTLQGLRDSAAIGLMLCAGVREGELRALDVEDLRQRLGGELALHVREGKGCKERLIPYGELSWVLAIVDAWLDAAGIEDGPVFRGLWKGGKSLRPGRISLRAIGYVLDAYPIMAGDKLTTVKPHDCRRTYARRLYEAGVDLVAIQQNLGHSDLKTTLGYVGELDASKRRPPSVYTFDLGQLNGKRRLL